MERRAIARPVPHTEDQIEAVRQNAPVEFTIHREIDEATLAEAQAKHDAVAAHAVSANMGDEDFRQAVDASRRK